MKKSLIDHIHCISEELYALSLVRKDGQDHAYLILEGVDDSGGRTIADAHLVYKEDTKYTKADIIYRDNITIEQLVEAAINCHAYTWHLMPEKAEALLTLIQAEQERGEKGLITYIPLGDTKPSGLFGASSEKLGSQQIQEDLLNSIEKKFSANNKVSLISRDALRSLLVSGHNCHSWAEAMVKSLNLPTPEKWTKFLAYDPKKQINGINNGDNIQPRKSGKTL